MSTWHCRYSVGVVKFICIQYSVSMLLNSIINLNIDTRLALAVAKNQLTKQVIEWTLQR